MLGKNNTIVQETQLHLQMLQRKNIQYSKVLNPIVFFKWMLYWKGSYYNPVLAYNNIYKYKYLSLTTQ